MKKIIRCLCMLVNVFCISQAGELVDSFIYCDGTFFQELYKKSLSNDLPVKTSESNRIAWFEVEDPNNPDQATLFFEKNINDGDFSLAGFYDSRIDLSKYQFEQFYFWGIYLNEPIEKVQQALSSAYQWQKDENTFVNKFIFQNDEKVMRSISLQQIEGKTLLLCTVEGSISKDILLKYRPDLK